MSNRSSGSTSKISQDELNDLILKLQALLPQLSRRQDASRVSASKVLKETCSYIRSLQREVDDLSEKLSKLLDSMDMIDIDLETIGSILQ